MFIRSAQTDVWCLRCAALREAVTSPEIRAQGGARRRLLFYVFVVFVVSYFSFVN